MSRNSSTILFIAQVFLASIVILSFLYPDLWFYHHRRLLIAHETLAPWESTYILVSHFFHGGIQLWDRFDQMNNAYFVLSNGVYGVVNIITAFVFIILSPFFVHQAEALYHTHLILFYGLTCLIRTIGGYVLLRRFISHQGVIFISLIYLNTVLTSYMMTPGIVTQGVYSFLPLLLYFILCFFEDFRLRTFLLIVLVMILCFVNSPLFTLGYFYLVVHFFILSCGACFIWQQGWKKIPQRKAVPKKEIFENIGIAGGCAVIILPYLWWGQALQHDFYIHGSGLGETQGRFNNIFNLSGYFNVQGKSFSNPLEFLGTSLDYSHNVWGSSWAFIGGSTLFFALAGLILSKDQRKYIFAAAILCVILLNTACFPGNFFVFGQFIKAALQNPSGFWANGNHLSEGLLCFWLMIASIVHGINALTNPFSFLVRSFHMSALLVPILFLPLMAMGVDSCLSLWQRKLEGIHFKRRWLLIALYFFIFCWSLLGGAKFLSVYNMGQGAALTLKEYTLSLAGVFFLLVLTPSFFSSDQRWVGRIILGIIILADFTAFMVYVQARPNAYPDNTMGTRLSPSYTHQAVVPDYQNPRILPLREFVNAQVISIYPTIDAQQCMYGAFYQYTPMGRFFRPWSIYEPRPDSYKNLYPDNEIQEYLKINPRNIYFADFAFDSRYLGLSDILRSNLSQRVIIVDQEEFNKPFLKTAERVSVPPINAEERIYNVSMDWTKAKFHQTSIGGLYTFDLPKDFPAYLSTTVFTNDFTSWKLMMGSRVLDPMQGKLTTPFTFDVQNIQEGKLTILLPGDKLLQENIDLQVKLPQKINGVWKNTFDDLGLTYEAPRSGWIVFNYPYDKKWELSIDGHKTPISRVDRYFLGAPVLRGEHQILLRYWPHTPLRFLIFISMLLSTICFWRIILYSLEREPIH